ncbi:hypothetical protein EB72_16385, partial [Mycobacterium sp. SWH-M1]
MPGNVGRLACAITIAALLALHSIAGASAEPSPGVPCMDLLHDLAADPPPVPDVIESAATALNSFVPQQVPEAPALETAHGLSAAAPPGPVPAPVDAPPLMAAPVDQSAAVPAAPAAPAVPVVPVVPPA